MCLAPVANLLVCVAVSWVAMCRLNIASTDTHKGERGQLVALLVGSMASALQPVLWGSLPGWGAVLMAGAVLAYLLPVVTLWRRLTWLAFTLRS